MIGRVDREGRVPPGLPFCSSATFPAFRRTCSPFTRPAWGATGTPCPPAPRCGFNSRAPRGARLPVAGLSLQPFQFQFTRPTRGATAGTRRTADYRRVSIHAPHAGRDGRDERAVLVRGVSIHAPHAGRDFPASSAPSAGAAFQFTRPTRGATNVLADVLSNAGFQFTRPRGARHNNIPQSQQTARVSIHAPAWGATAWTSGRWRRSWFQFTRPRGARQGRRADGAGD